MNINKAKVIFSMVFTLVVFLGFSAVIKADTVTFGNWAGLYNSHCGPTASTYGDYYGYGPGNTYVGGTIQPGLGQQYTDVNGNQMKCPDALYWTLERFINIGAPIPLADIYQIDMVGDGDNNPKSFYISQDGSNWYLIGTGNRNEIKSYTQSQLGTIPISYVKYLRSTSGSYNDYFNVWIHYNNDVTPPTSSGFQDHYSHATTEPFRVHMYNINDDKSGVNRVEYWSRKVRLDGVDEGWIHHGAGHFWNDGVGGVDSYFDVPNRGEGQYEVHARVYDNKGNVAGPWSMWVYIDHTSPSTGIPDYNDGTMRYTNAPDGTTVRFHVKNVRDNLSGIRNVRFWRMMNDTNVWSHEADGINYYNNEAFYYDMPIEGEGNYLVRAHALDHAGNGHGQNGWSSNVDMRVIVDRTIPTFTSLTVSGRRLNTDTFRVEVFGAADHLAGVNRVQFPTWTIEGGQDDMIWYNGIHAGNGHWYVDIPIANHGNAQGEYMTHPYVFDHAGNQTNTAINTIIDRTMPQLISSEIEDADYINGTDYWVKSNQTLKIKVRAGDDISGIRKMEISAHDGVYGGDEAANASFDWNTLMGTKLDQPSAYSYKWKHFQYNEINQSYKSGTVSEAQLIMTVNSTTQVLKHDTQVQIEDDAGNFMSWKNLNKRIIIDGEKPIGDVTENISKMTNNNIILTASGNDGNGSGIKRIKLPDGSYVNKHSTTYTVGQNGTYSFVFEDNVGNQTTKSITVSNVDKENPLITFTPETIAGDFKDLKVQMDIQDVGVSGYKQYRYVWTKEKSYPTEGWSDWNMTENPIIIQDTVGAWMLHIEAEDHAGNIAYAMSGTYEKIMMSGPSVNLSVYPIPTGKWLKQSIDVYIMESGDADMLAKATKKYEITNNSLYPTNFTKNIPHDKKIQLNLIGENFVHVQYILDDGTKIVSTLGPYLIDTGMVGDFEMQLQQEDGTNVTGWNGKQLQLVISNPANSSISGYQKQYRIEGLHQDWQSYKEGVFINLEGKHRIYGRIINQAGEVSEQKWVDSLIDLSTPSVNQIRLEVNEDGTYGVAVNTSDSLSGVAEVVLNDGTALTPKGNNFTLNGLVIKPNSFTVKDKAGNVTPVMTFAKEPMIAFQSPYDESASIYRNDVIATISDVTNYTIGRKNELCTAATCTVTIQVNGKLTVVNEEGVKETRKTVSIDNLDKSKLLLVLNGKRNTILPTNLTFSWNYALDSGELVCTVGGTTETHLVNEKSYQFAGINAHYECYVEGTYAGELVRSNRVTIFTDKTLPMDGQTSIEEIPKGFNVYVDEGSSGDAYMINAKSDNYKHTKIPFPKGAIE